MNGGFFDPETGTLTVHVHINDLCVTQSDDGWVTLDVAHLDEGIEIYYEGDRIWRAVK